MEREPVFKRSIEEAQELRDAKDIHEATAYFWAKTLMPKLDFPGESKTSVFVSVGTMRRRESEESLAKKIGGFARAIYQQSLRAGLDPRAFTVDPEGIPSTRIKAAARLSGIILDGLLPSYSIETVVKSNLKARNPLAYRRTSEVFVVLSDIYIERIFPRSSQLSFLDLDRIPRPKFKANCGCTGLGTLC